MPMRKPWTGPSPPATSTADGNNSVNIDGYVPDMKRHVGVIDITFNSKEFPADTAPLHTETEAIDEGGASWIFVTLAARCSSRSPDWRDRRRFPAGAQRVEIGNSGRAGMRTIYLL